MGLTSEVKKSGRGRRNARHTTDMSVAAVDREVRRERERPQREQDARTTNRIRAERSAKLSLAKGDRVTDGKISGVVVTVINTERIEIRRPFGRLECVSPEFLTKL